MAWADDPELLATFCTEVQDRLASLSDGHVQVVAQGVHQKPIISGKGLIERHQLGGRAQGLAAGLRPGRRYLGH